MSTAGHDAEEEAMGKVLVVLSVIFTLVACKEKTRAPRAATEPATTFNKLLIANQKPKAPPCAPPGDLAGWTRNDSGELATIEGPLYPNMEHFFVAQPAFADLSPLKAAPELTKITLRHTAVCNLAPLAGLKKLRKLDLSDTWVTSIKHLAGLTTIEELNLETKLGIADIRPLAGLVTLTNLSLNLEDGKPINLEPLRGLKALQVLRVETGAEGITDLKPLASLVALKWLVLTGAKIKDLAPLAGLKQLESLKLLHSTVKDISALANCGRLKTLDLKATPVADISALSGKHHLTVLNLDHTQVTDLAPLMGLKALDTLAVRGLKVSKKQLRALKKARPELQVHE
jgi:internalin A